MKRMTIAVAALAGLGLCAGCEQDFYAKQIIVHNTDSGKLALDLTGPAEQLIKQKRIDLNPRLTMADGTEIDVWVIKAKADPPAPPRATALLLHGLTASKAKYLRAGERLAKMGYDVVLPDLRAHGHSGGDYVTFGAKEKADVKQVIDALVGGGTVHRDVYVFGETLGAATAIQYATIDTRCKGIVAVDPYRDAASQGRRLLVLLAPAMSNRDFDKCLARAGEIADFDPNQASSEIAAASVTCPLLIVYGLLSVPAEDCKAIYDAAKGPKKLQPIAPLPGPEQLGFLADYQGWVADKVHKMATSGVLDESPKPAPAPATAPAGGT